MNLCLCHSNNLIIIMETTMLNNDNSQSSFMPMAPQDNSYRNNNGFIVLVDRK